MSHHWCGGALAAPRAVAAAVVLVVAVMCATPASAIETATWGITPAPGPEGTRSSAFHPEIRPGRTTTSAVELWNKGTTPLKLRLSATPAQVVDGEAALGGDGTGVSWISFRHPEITLSPGALQRVEFEIRAPHSLPSSDVAVAILATPSTEGSAAPAVMERLAVMAYLAPAAGAPRSVSPGLGLLPFVASLLLGAVLVGTVLHRRARVSPRRG